MENLKHSMGFVIMAMSLAIFGMIGYYDLHEYSVFYIMGAIVGSLVIVGLLSTTSLAQGISKLIIRVLEGVGNTIGFIFNLICRGLAWIRNRFNVLVGL